MAVSSHTNRFQLVRFKHKELQGGTTSRGDFSRRTVVWSNPDEYGPCCHYGGGMSFGPDEAIYITTGDMGDPMSSQDMSVAAGKILRINPDGTIPKDNLGAQNRKHVDAIWALGLRNPFRSRWDLGDGSKGSEPRL